MSRMFITKTVPERTGRLFKCCPDCDLEVEAFRDLKKVALAIHSYSNVAVAVAFECPCGAEFSMEDAETGIEDYPSALSPLPSNGPLRMGTAPKDRAAS